MRRAFAGILISALFACDEDRRVEIDDPEKLEKLAEVSGVDGTLIVDVPSAKTIELPKLTGVYGSLYLTVGPETTLVDLSRLEGVGTFLMISGTEARSKPLEVRLPELYYIGTGLGISNLSRATIPFPALTHCGDVNLIALDRSEVSFPALAAFEGGFNLTHISRSKVSAAIESAGSVELKMIDDTRVALDSLRAQVWPGLDGFVVETISTSTISAPSLTEVIGGLRVDVLYRSHVDLSTLTSAKMFPVVGNRPGSEALPTIAESRLELGPFLGSRVALKVLASVVELRGSSFDSLSVQGQDSRIELPELKSVEFATITAASVAAPLLETTNNLRIIGDSVDLPRLRWASRLFISGTGAEALSLPALQTVSQRLVLEDTHAISVSLPALVTIGGETRDDVCDDGLHLVRNAELAEIDFPALRELSGELWIQLNPKLRSCEVRAELARVSRAQPACEELILDNLETCP